MAGAQGAKGGVLKVRSVKVKSDHLKTLNFITCVIRNCGRVLSSEN